MGFSKGMYIRQMVKGWLVFLATYISLFSFFIFFLLFPKCVYWVCSIDLGDGKEKKWKKNEEKNPHPRDFFS